MTSEGGRPIVRVHLGVTDGWLRMMMHQALSDAAKARGARGTGDECYERCDELFCFLCFFFFGSPGPLSFDALVT